MSASVNDKLTDTRNAARPNSARATGTRSSGGTSLACDDLTGWPTASKVHFVTYQIDSNSNPVAGTQLDCYGIVSGNTIGSFTVIDGTDTGNQVNDVVEMLPTAAWGQDLADGLTTSLNRDGTIKDGAVSSASMLGTGVVTSAKILDGTIVAGDISSGAITPAKLSRNVISKAGATISATGNYVVTGVGFQPRVIQINAYLAQTISSTRNSSVSFGTYDSTVAVSQCLSFVASSNAFGSNGLDTSHILFTQTGTGTVQAAGSITALSSDGFTLNISSYGTVPTDWIYTCFA